MTVVAPRQSGWRFWIVHPGPDVVLRSPYGVGLPWSATVERAVCRAHPEHRAPAYGCLCGIYADRTAAAAVARMRAFRTTVNGWSAVLECAGAGAPVDRPAYVVGRVALTDAETFVVPHFLTNFNDEEGELRAAAAEILGLYVDDDEDVPVQVVASQLSARYGVPVHTR